jgi:hypothetical protein
MTTQPYCTRCDHYVADYIWSREVFSDSAPSECECRCHH